MRKGILFLLLPALWFFSCNKESTPAPDPPGPDPRIHNVSYTHNGVDRTCILYLPNNMPDSATLVIGLHGITETSKVFMNECRMNYLADQHKFAVCYPQGLRDSINNDLHWNARMKISSVDDIGFLSGLTAYLHYEYGFAPERTYIFGYSNGGFMCYTLACEVPGLFKAIASVSGTMSLYTWENHNSAQPVPLLQIHGLEDPYIPFTGLTYDNPYYGDSTWGWAGAPAIPVIINEWVNLNACGPVDTFYFPPSTTAYYYLDSIQGNDVWLYTIENHGHAYPIESATGISASKEIWKFFSQY